MTDLKDLTTEGTTLVVSVDPDKTPMFVLKGGEWQNTEIGGPATPEMLQAYLDANELVVGDVIEVPAEETPEPTSELPTTLSVATLDEFQAYLEEAAAGTQLTLEDKVVTKDADGLWLLKSGLPQRPISFYFYRDKVTVGTGEAPQARKIPETAPEPVVPEAPTTEVVEPATSAEPEEIVLDDADLPEESLTEEDLAQLSEGDLISYSSDRGVTQFSRRSDGTWESELTGGIYGTQLLLSVTGRGKLFLSDDTPTIELGNKHYPESALRVALAALESHSGFQISYALKPINSPLLEEDLVGLSAEAFPDAATKKFAVISLLKSKLGIEQPKDDSPIVHLAGKEELAFTTKQVEEAVEILDKYRGKLYRNELVVKGSALGAIAPSDVVGFHKDKLEGKKAFTQVLREALQK